MNKQIHVIAQLKDGQPAQENKMKYKPKAPPLVVMSVRVAPELQEWVSHQAKKEGLKPSDWVRQTLRNMKESGNAND